MQVHYPHGKSLLSFMREFRQHLQFRQESAVVYVDVPIMIGRRRTKLP